jgi:hypothetical protein
VQVEHLVAKELAKIPKILFVLLFRQVLEFYFQVLSKILIYIFVQYIAKMLAIFFSNP